MSEYRILKLDDGAEIQLDEYHITIGDKDVGMPIRWSDWDAVQEFIEENKRYYQKEATDEH